MRESLEAAAAIEFDELYLACVTAQKAIEDAGFEVPIVQNKEKLVHLQEDAFSKSLLPSDWKDITPIQCYGDGNCLYRYGCVWYIPMSMCTCESDDGSGVCGI